MIQDLGRKLVGDGNDPEVVERIEAELAAEATQAAFIKEMDADRHRVYKLAQETKSSLQTATAELAKAQTAASAKLEEALAAWYRFEPSGMRRETQAIIEKAVRLYLTNPDKHSFAKIAADFNVTPKTVSVWFKKFEKETGYRVVTHRRHESVRDRLKREQSRTLPPKGTIAHHTAGNW
jgi:transposase